MAPFSPLLGQGTPFGRMADKTEGAHTVFVVMCLVNHVFKLAIHAQFDEDLKVRIALNDISPEQEGVAAVKEC